MNDLTFDSRLDSMSRHIEQAKIAAEYGDAKRCENHLDVVDDHILNMKMELIRKRAEMKVLLG